MPFRAKSIVTFLLCMASVSAVPKPTPAPTPDYSKITAEEIEKTIEHRNELAAQQDKTLADQSVTIANQAQSLKNASEATKSAIQTFLDYQMATEATVTKANKAIAALDKILAKLHLAKWIMCGLAIAAIAFIAIRLPPPLSLYIGGGAAVAAVAAIWLWL